jgi:hypothetical protein
MHGIGFPPLVAGIIPMLMVAAARRGGDRLPTKVLWIVGRAPVVWTIWTLFLIGVLVHIVIWEGTLDRLAAGGTAVAAVVVRHVIWQRGAVRPRATLELRYEAEGGPPRPYVGLVADGRQVAVETSVAADQLRVEVPLLAVPTLRVWAHLTTGADTSEALPLEALVEAPDGTGTPQRVVLDAGGEAAIALRGQPVRLLFSRPPAASRDCRFAARGGPGGRSHGCLGVPWAAGIL